MPFLSKRQQKYMFANKDILGKKGLEEWSNKTDFKKLPNKVKKSSTGFILEKSDNPEHKKATHFRTSKTGKVFQAGKGSKNIKSKNIPIVPTNSFSFNKKDNNEFEIKDTLGGRTFGLINGDEAKIIQIDAIPSEHRYTDESSKYKGRGFFQSTIKELSKQGINKLRVNLQSEDTIKVLKRLVDKKVLTNPRELRGVSTDEYPTVFDIVKDSVTKSVKTYKLKVPEVDPTGYISFFRPHLCIEINKK